MQTRNPRLNMTQRNPGEDRITESREKTKRKNITNLK